MTPEINLDYDGDMGAFIVYVLESEQVRMSTTEPPEIWFIHEMVGIYASHRLAADAAREHKPDRRHQRHRILAWELIHEGPDLDGAA